MPDRGLENASIQLWGAIRSLLRAGQDSLSPEDHEAMCEEVDRHVCAASDSIPPHLEERMSRVVRQMRATTSYDDDGPTLVGEELAG